ncbi:hypothetical protein GE09DRAFT_609597 [Coniochaeta sp. 2T2.1]|nr:hypothetical protein GE09DRAFT_609597 [Coniochaeta sp. 2T2.1]
MIGDRSGSRDWWPRVVAAVDGWKVHFLPVFLAALGLRCFAGHERCGFYDRAGYLHRGGEKVQCSPAETLLPDDIYRSAWSGFKTPCLSAPRIEMAGYARDAQCYLRPGPAAPTRSRGLVWDGSIDSQSRYSLPSSIFVSSLVGLPAGVFILWLFWSGTLLSRRASKQATLCPSPRCPCPADRQKRDNVAFVTGTYLR